MWCIYHLFIVPGVNRFKADYIGVETIEYDFFKVVHTVPVPIGHDGTSSCNTVCYKWAVSFTSIVL